MLTPQPPQSRLGRFDRSARLVALAALLLLLGSVGQIAYRYTLPTEGWAVLSDEAVGGSWILYGNLVGAESGLRPDDVLLAVDGVDVSGTAAEIYIPAPADWRTGQRGDHDGAARRGYPVHPGAGGGLDAGGHLALQRRSIRRSCPPWPGRCFS